MRNLTPSEMDPQRWQRIEALYNSALNLSVKERELWLSEHCDDDESIRIEVLSLLESADTSDSFLEEPAFSFGLRIMGLERESLIGSDIGRYRIVEMLGQGGMGEVYLAEDSRLTRRVALKLLPASITDDQERVRRFDQEARAASAISHPNVAHIYEIGESQGRHYITMEYVKGRTLRQILRERSLSTDKALNIAIQVASALSAAHRAGVIHRDIKPENIIITDDDYAKVLDFGLAKLIEKENSTSEAQLLSSLHTSPDLFMGTSHYMSPEQVRRQPVDLRTDLWSLGVVIYEMLTFSRPFQGESFSEVIVAIIEKEPEFDSRDYFRPPNPTQALLSRALQKSPEIRYQTADGMLVDLRQLQRQMAKAGNLPRGDESPPEKAVHPTNSNKADREPAPTAPDPIRLNTLGQRMDTLFENSKSHRSVLALARASLSQRWIQVTVALLLLAGVATSYRMFRRHPGTLAASAINLRFERLNLFGDITDITLSPDGKYVARVIPEDGKPAIHITELATASDLRVAVSSGEAYRGLAFSPDGTYLYYLEDHGRAGTLYRVSKLGGGQRKVLDNTQSPVTFAPDGTQIAFVRSSNEFGDIVVSASDGVAERTLIRRTVSDADKFLSSPRGAGPAWSHDGKVLACITSNTTHEPLEMNIEVIDAESGTSRRLNLRPLLKISRLVWLADGSGLLVAAIDAPGAPWQLHMIAYPGGEVRKVTNDPNNYRLVSGGSDSARFLTLNIEDNSTAWQTSFADKAEATPLAIGQTKGVSEIETSVEHHLLYAVNDGTNTNLWVQNASADSARQLTFGAQNFNPAVSPDGQYVVFSSSQSGQPNIWRINADGSHPNKLTSGADDDTPSVTPDGKWVMYRAPDAIMKVSMEGGNPAKLIEKRTYYPALSPDGRQVAFFASDSSTGKDWHIEVYRLENASLIDRVELPEAINPFAKLRWTPDGKGLAYVSNSDGASNIWMKRLGGSPPQQLTHFKDAEILSFTWSADGKAVLCVRNSTTYVPLLVRLF